MFPACAFEHDLEMEQVAQIEPANPQCSRGNGKATSPLQMNWQAANGRDCSKTQGK